MQLENNKQKIVPVDNFFVYYVYKSRLPNQYLDVTQRLSQGETLRDYPRRRQEDTRTLWRQHFSRGLYFAVLLISFTYYCQCFCTRWRFVFFLRDSSRITSLTYRALGCILNKLSLFYTGSLASLWHFRDSLDDLHAGVWFFLREVTGKSKIWYSNVAVFI